MAASYKVNIKVVSQNGICAAGHKVDDHWVIDHETSMGICIWAWNAIFPFVSMFRYGGVLPWKEGSTLVTLRCPDPHNEVVFEVMRGDTLK